MRYRLFDFALESDIEFPELARAPGIEPLLRLKREPAASTNAFASSLRAWDEGVQDAPWLQVAHCQRGLTLVFANSLSVRCEGSCLFWSSPEQPRSFRHTMLDQVLPLVAAHKGRLILHGAGVIHGDRLRLLLGPSGAGKSTLAAAFLRAGCSLVSDDAVQITCGTKGRVLAQPSYFGLRLRRDACTALGFARGSRLVAGSTKRRFPTRATRGPFVVTSVDLVDVSPANQPELSAPLGPRDALIALLSNSYVLDYTDGTRSIDHLDALATLARRVPVRHLLVPRGFDRLDHVVTLLSEWSAGH